MKGKIFIDSNILLYLFSKTEPNKRQLGEQLIRQYDKTNQLVWSTQVIQEFYSVMTRKYGEDPLRVKSILGLFENFELVVNDKENIEQAIDIQVVHQLSFWDSLIISSAISSKCNYLLTEDLNKGQIIRGIQLLNPFDVIIE